MKGLKSISSLKVLSREEQGNVFGGSVIGGFSCKSGNSSISGEWDTLEQLRASARNSCVNQGGVGTVFYFEEEEQEGPY